METKHTPGPWRVDGLLIKAIDHGKWFGIAKAGGKKLTIDSNIANARLIASAPDLLAERDRLRQINAELLEALHCIAAQSLGDDWIAEQAMAFVKEEARAAIARAKGE